MADHRRSYVKRVEALGRTPYSIAADLGLSRRQSYRYAEPGGPAITETIDHLLQMFERHGIPEAWD